MRRRGTGRGVELVTGGAGPGGPDLTDGHGRLSCAWIQPTEDVRPMSGSITLQEAERLAQRALERAGTAAGAAASVARALARAEADGLASHGLARVPAYCAQVQSGKVDGGAVPRLVPLGPAAARVDAGYGFAFPALDLAVAAAAERAETTGVGAVAIARSHHFGVAGHHVERLAERGLVGLIMGNSPGGIAPWGGRRALLGTNPIAFACPRQAAPPLVIDVSLAKVARGKVMLAAQQGAPIPEGWALDAEGRPTTDANAALAGTMLPLGGAKGAALALMVEILAAALTGSSFAAEASSFFDDQGPPPGVGQFLLALDPAPFSDNFLDRLAVLLGAIEAEPRARLPGARRLALRRKAETEGIAVPQPLLEQIRALAGDPGLAPGGGP
jgi:(2R)-3-sulfolactate dehydrogenase (NADP+)